MSIVEKYNFLLDMLHITDVDLWERDALLRLKAPIYFQLTADNPTVDDAVEAAMASWQSTRSIPK